MWHLIGIKRKAKDREKLGATANQRVSLSCSKSVFLKSEQHYPLVGTGKIQMAIVEAIEIKSKERIVKK